MFGRKKAPPPPPKNTEGGKRLMAQVCIKKLSHLCSWLFTHILFI